MERKKATEELEHWKEQQRQKVEVSCSNSHEFFLVVIFFLIFFRHGEPFGFKRWAFKTMSCVIVIFVGIFHKLMKLSVNNYDHNNKLSCDDWFGWGPFCVVWWLYKLFEVRDAGL